MNFGGTRCAVGTYAGFHLGALTDTLYIAGNAGIFNSPWTRTIVYDGAVSGINTITNSRAAQERMHNIYGHPADRNTTKNTKRSRGRTKTGDQESEDENTHHSESFEQRLQYWNKIIARA